MQLIMVESNQVDGSSIYFVELLLKFSQLLKQIQKKPLVFYRKLAQSTIDKQLWRKQVESIKFILFYMLNCNIQYIILLSNNEIS